MRTIAVGGICLMVCTTLAPLIAAPAATADLHSCFFTDFDEDGNPWTLRTATDDPQASFDIIVEVGDLSPAGSYFFVPIDSPCRDILGQSEPQDCYAVYFGALEFDPDYVDFATIGYGIGFGCAANAPVLEMAIASDAPFETGQRYVLGSGSVSSCVENECTDLPRYFRFPLSPEGCDGADPRMVFECPQSAIDGPEWEASRGRLSLLGSNPVLGTLSCRARLDHPGRMRLRIFDLRGRVVQSLYDGEANAGSRQFHCRTSDVTGHEWPSGLYFVRMEAEGRTESIRFLLAR